MVNAPSLLSYPGSFGALFGEGVWNTQTRELLTALLGTAIGLWLLFGARRLATLVDRARGAGLQHAEKAWKSSWPGRNPRPSSRFQAPRRPFSPLPGGTQGEKADPAARIPTFVRSC